MFFAFFSLFVYLVIWLLISFGILPNISNIFLISKELDHTTLLILKGLIIFLEGIIYIGFYLPGQFIAVILVTTSADSWIDIIPLTLISIVAVTLSATVNYGLGMIFRKKKDKEISKIDWKKLLLSMIHINTLALALFEAGKHHAPKWIIAIVGIINLPYYFIIIALTYSFKETIIKVGENPYYLLTALIIWCGYSVWKNERSH